MHSESQIYDYHNKSDLSVVAVFAGIFAFRCISIPIGINNDGL